MILKDINFTQDNVLIKDKLDPDIIDIAYHNDYS